MKDPIWWSESLARIELQFKDRDQVESIYHQGDCEDSTRSEMDHFVPQLERHPTDLVIEILQDAGFDLSEIEQDSRDDNLMRLVWMAAGDLYDVIQMAED